jgi:ribosomal protein S27E
MTVSSINLVQPTVAERFLELPREECEPALQLSPAFAASQVRCESCGRTIAVT